MIKGVLNDRLEPMVVLEISNGDGRFQPVEALLDTGFTEELTMPPDAVARLGLEHVEQTHMTLADGQRIEASMYKGYVNWFGYAQRIDVHAVDGLPLIGMSLLEGCKFTVSVRAGGEVAIEEDREA